MLSVLLQHAPADRQVSTTLNEIVTASSRLQLALRSAYHDPEQCVGHTKLPPGERLSRLIDVQQRWANMSPKRIEVLKCDPGGLLSQGIFVSAGEERDNEDGHELADEESSDGGDNYYQPFNAWTTYDLTDVRDAPAGKWPQSPGYRFASYAISREENLIAIARFPVLDEEECEVYLYLLDPGGNGGELNRTPVQHPQAVPNGYFTARVSCTDTVDITLVGGVVQVSSCFMTGMWDWRTGEETMVSTRTCRCER